MLERLWRDAGVRHAIVSIPICRSRSRDCSPRVFSERIPTSCLSKKFEGNAFNRAGNSSQRECSARNNSRLEHDYEWIQDFCYCSDYVGWRDKFCECPVPVVGDPTSKFVSGAISRSGCVERLRTDTSRQNGPSTPWRRGSLVWAQQGL